MTDNVNEFMAVIRDYVCVMVNSEKTNSYQIFTEELEPKDFEIMQKNINYMAIKRKERNSTMRLI
jgi:hypothetical protein